MNTGGIASLGRQNSAFCRTNAIVFATQNGCLHHVHWSKLNFVT